MSRLGHPAVAARTVTKKLSQLPPELAERFYKLKD